MSASKTSRRPRALRVEIQDLLNESLSHNFPDLGEFCDFITVKGDVLEKFGDDYQCPNVLTVCEKLRARDTELFRKSGTEDIAKVIMNNLQKSKMVQQVSIRGGCFLSFKLSWEWMAERIKNMLDDGIDVWAPVYSLRRAHIEFPTGDVDFKMHGDVFRSEYISLMLKEMFSYSGIPCTVAPVTQQSLSRKTGFVEGAVKKCFVVEHGEYKKRGKNGPLFVGSGGERGFINVDIDLGRLWRASCRDDAHFILYITPVRLRAYVEKCIAAAKDVKWVEDRKCIVACRGYRTSGNERGKLGSLIAEFIKYSGAAPLHSLLLLGMAAGYTMTPESFFASVLRYTYLRTPRLVEVTFCLEEMLDGKGNSLVYILNTQALIRSIIKNSCIGTSEFKLTKVSVAKERELGLHIVRFTDVIEEACATVSPHMVCEYLCDLCTKFTSCYSGVYLLANVVRPVESGLLLCRATEAIMRKCLQLLCIDLSGDSLLPIYRFLSEEEVATVSCFNPWPISVASPENPRFEMFSMYLSLFDLDFQEGNMSGYISVSDKYGLHPDAWSSLFVGDVGHIDYFSRDWCDSLRITNDSSHFFGNPNARHAVAFSSSIEIHIRLAITIKKTKEFQDACYQIYSESEKKLSIWEEDKKIKCKCDTMSFKSKDGLLQIHYILLGDAVDTTIDIRFESRVPGLKCLKVRGHVFAYYGDGVLDEKDDLMQMFYKAIIFKTDRARIFAGEQLRLKRSVVSVPANGCLMIRSFLEDLETGEVIVNEPREFRAQPTCISNWDMQGEKGTFHLRVHWSKGLGIIS